jgi:segregation and condensation protein B
MSLKAKIEAVIYAAEEPVTLAQIVGLLGLEAQAELDRLASAQHALTWEEVPSPPSEPDPLNEEVLFVDDLEAEDVEVSELQAEGAFYESAAPESTSQQPEALSEPSEAHNPKQNAQDEKGRARAVRDYLRELLDELVRDYAAPDRGIEIREVAGGFRLATKPEYHDAVRGFVRSLKPPLKLSLQALETLAVVAYKQPVTAPEISEIRGVDSGGVLGSLMARKLVTTAGRKQVIGRPILYKTTKDFLLRFGLKDINELPSIEEFEKMAGELAESDPIQEEIPMAQHISAESPHSDPELARRNESIEDTVASANVEQEKNSTEPQADGDGATVDRVTPDGRLSGIAPTANSLDTNPSAVEAEIQQREHNEP